MKRLLLVALVALAATTSAAADSFPSSSLPGGSLPSGSLTSTALPSADTPNISTVLFPQLLVAPAQPQLLTYDQLLPIWQGAAQAYGVPWSVLAAINKVESNFGQNMGPSSAGAIGWMQFMPDTWARWGIDANGDGVADPWNAEDAIYSSARYLAATGGAADISGAVFSYNHAQWYVDEVLQLAQQYEGGGVTFSDALNNAQQQIDAATQAVADANAKLLDAQAVLADVQSKEDTLLAAARNDQNFTDRLNAQKMAAIADYKVQAAQADVDALQAELQTAQDALETARSQTSSTAFAPGAGVLLGAPAYSNGYVFPVAGGPGLVHVGHTHHDYPAADIAAPEGSQLYALSDGTVTETWPTPTGNCGIGFTIATTDGLTWTYCHLSYLEPAVLPAATLAAGQPVGFVGHTGHAEGPHLHLQLQPATGYPQDEPWFQSFAGTAFSWLDSVQTNAAPNPVFAVVGDAPDPSRSLDSAALASSQVVYFTATGG
jgi:murein DD-endopeptidase MepM/ murein hydrolase activator NlpD